MKLFTKYNIPDNASFVNVELTKDNTIWIDPMMMYMDKSEMGKKMLFNCTTIFFAFIKLSNK